MTPILALMLLACAARHPAVTPERVEVVDQFAVRTRGMTLAGQVVAVLTPEAVEARALSPAGTSLFTWRADADGREVHAPDPSWEPWLARMPLDRDLRLVHAWRCPEARRCRAGGGTLRQEAGGDGTLELRWRRGLRRVRATVQPGRATVSAPGYEVRLAGEDVGVR